VSARAPTAARGPTRDAAPPTASLVVSTYNWPAALDLVLDSVRRQRRLPEQVLVADDGSGPETRALVARHAERLAAVGVPLVHVWQEDVGFRKARVMNQAFAAATGDYLLTVDGDVVLHPDFVRSHLAFARRGTFVQGGRVLLSEARTRRALAERALHVSPFARGVRNRVNAISAPWLAALLPQPAEQLAGARGVNLALWRDDVLRVNGYDERFEGWGREDSELTARLLAAGLRRRRLRFAGIVYPLWHAQQPRDALGENDRLLEAVIASGESRCERGLSQYLPEYRGAPAPR
jgi:GT2 family glycosyltransferase